MMQRIVTLMLLTLACMYAKPLAITQNFNRKIVTVQSVERTVNRTFYAKTAYDESAISDITLRLSGFVERLYADTNFMYVHKGEKLFKLYSDTLSEIGSEIRLARKSGQLTAAKNLKKRLKLLDIEGKIASDYTVDISAPRSGIIIEKLLHEGSFVQKGQRLYRIADMSRMWVLFQFYQKDIPFVKEGMQATVAIEGLAPRKAKVAYIYPFMNPKTRTIDARIVLPNEDGEIYPNLFAKVTLHGTPQKMLILPKSAVLTKGAKHFVFKPLDDGSFEPVEVNAVRLDAHTYQILSGLHAGEKVIDKALFLLDADAITNGLYESDEDEDW